MRELDGGLALDILEGAPLLVVVLDRDGRIAAVNRSFEQATGQPRDEVAGQVWFATFPPPPGALVPLVSRAGDPRMIEWQTEVQRDGDGAIVRVVCLGKDVTEQQRLGDALRAGEASLREAQQLSKIGSWELDLVAGQLRWSDEVFRIFEIDPTRFGASYAAFLATVHPDDRAMVDDAYRASVDSQQPYEVVHRLRMADGRIKTVRERGRSYYDACGIPIRSIGTVHDITAQVGAERRLRRILDGMGVFVMLHDLAGNVVEVNHGLVERCGQPRDQLLGRPAWDAPWWSHAEPVQQQVRAALAAVAAGAQVRADLPMRLGADEIVTMDVSFAPLLDDRGVTEGVIASAIDVTDHRHIEEQLRRASELLRTVVAGAPIVMFVVDRTGRVVLSEGQAVARLRLSPDQRLGESRLAECAGALELDGAVAGALAGAVKTLTSVGAGAEFEAVLAPRYDARGDIDGVIGVAIDVAERLRQDARIAAQLAEKEVLLRELHHRVKNNLQVIQSLLSLQRQYGSGPEVAAVLRDAGARISAMALVHEKLYATTGDHAHVGLVDYARDLASTLRSTYDVDPKRIAIAVSGDLVDVTLDQAVPYGLLLNELLSNALKHAFPGGASGTITIHFAVDRDRVVLEVGDDGVGIPAAQSHAGRATLGLRLLDGLTAQLRGTLRRSGPPGTHYRIEIERRAGRAG